MKIPPPPITATPVLIRNGAETRADRPRHRNDDVWRRGNFSSRVRNFPAAPDRRPVRRTAVALRHARRVGHVIDRQKLGTLLCRDA